MGELLEMLRDYFRAGEPRQLEPQELSPLPLTKPGLFDPEDAERVGRQTLWTLLHFLPGSGDYLSAQYSRQNASKMFDSLSKNRYVDAAAEGLTSLLDAVGTAPMVPAVLVAAPKAAIDAAKVLIKKGATVAEAGLATGAYRSRAGWVSELSDNDFTVSRVGGQEGKTFPMRTVIKHPALEKVFSADLRSSLVTVRPGTSEGAFAPYGGPGGQILLPGGATDSDLLKVAMHETGHLAQKASGLPIGTSVGEVLQKRYGVTEEVLNKELRGIELAARSRGGMYSLEELERVSDIEQLKFKAFGDYLEHPGEEAARESALRLGLTDEEKARTPLSAGFLLGPDEPFPRPDGGIGLAMSQERKAEGPFFSALLRNWEAFRTGKGAGQKAFTPEQLKARFERFGSQDELMAGGFLQVLDKLPKGTKLSGEQVTRWLERADLSKKVKGYELGAREGSWEALFRKTITEKLGISHRGPRLPTPKQASSLLRVMREQQARGIWASVDGKKLIARAATPEEQASRGRRIEAFETALRQYDPLRYDPDVQRYVRDAREGRSVDLDLRQTLEERYPERMDSEGPWEAIFGPLESGQPPLYPKSYIAPFSPFGPGDYREEWLAYGKTTKGMLIGAEERAKADLEQRLKREAELKRMLYPTETPEWNEALEWLREADDVASSLVGADTSFDAWNEARNIRSQAHHELRRLTHRVEGDEREKLLKEFWKLGESHDEEGTKRLVEALRQSAKPLKTEIGHGDKLDPFMFAWGRLVEAKDPELGKGTYAVELQSNLSAKAKQAVVPPVGPFVERGIGPEIDNMLYNAAKRGDKFVAVPVADKEFWKPRYGSDRDFEKGYKWLPAIYGEQGAAIKQLEARLKSIAGEKVKGERKILEFSVERNPAERQYQPAVVVPLSKKARMKILEEGFKISKLDDIMREALA